MRPDTQPRVAYAARLAAVQKILGEQLSDAINFPKSPIFQPSVEKVIEALRGFADAIEFEFYEADDSAMEVTISRPHTAHARWREALEIIAGERRNFDNLLGNADIARIALHGK